MAWSCAFCLMSILAAKEEAETPKVTRSSSSPEDCLGDHCATQTGELRSLSAGTSSTARYILLTLAVRATQ